MRKLGLDVGSVSCGIALSDALNITAQGKENFRFSQKNWNALIDRIFFYLQKYEIDVIVIGYPTLPSGDKSSTTLMIEEFKNLLESKVSQKVIFINEDKTTKQAREVMRLAGLNYKRQKKFKDKLAAQLILQDYLTRLI